MRASINSALKTLLLCVIVSGCQSTNNSVPLTPEQLQVNFDNLADKVGNDPSSVSYLKLFNQYLLTQQPISNIESYDKFLEVETQIQNSLLDCATVNWREITRADFWSIEPHMAALECYEQLGNSREAEKYTNIVNYLLEGIINSGDGKHYYSAYQIATWADANKIIELLEHEVIDEYLHFNPQNSLVYKVFLVNNLESGFQEQIWFENNRFLHSILGIQYPFAAVNNSLFTAIKEGFASYYPAAQVGIAKTLLTEESNRQEGFELLVKAVESGSAIANLELGWACLVYEQAIYAKDNCIEFLITAAEAGIAEAQLILALQHQEGFYSEQDRDFAEQLIRATESQFVPGKAQYLLALRYRNLDQDKFKQQYLVHLNLAAQQNHMPAKEDLWRKRLSERSEADTSEILWQELKQYAQQGSAYAAARYANYLNYKEDASDNDKDEARELLLTATKTNHPYSHFVAGRMYERGKLAYPNDLDAFLSYQQAAIRGHAVSQLQVGYYNDIGRAVETNKALALNWYFLCSKSYNSTCLGNIGIFYRDGIAIEKNQELAKVFFEVSSNLGNSNSMVNLGKLYDFGKGLYADKPKANELYLAACEKDNGEGCHYHAISLEDGDGIDRNVGEALTFYQKACSLNVGDSCFRYGEVLWEGKLLKQDFQQAITLFEKACQYQNGYACMKLARAYFDGVEVTKNINTAAEYRVLACRANYKICYHLD